MVSWEVLQVDLDHVLYVSIAHVRARDKLGQREVVEMD